MALNLNQTLQNKYPHLEISVLKYSDAMKDNDSKRIDSEFFKKEYLNFKNLLLNKQNNYLKNIANFNKRYPQPDYDEKSNIKVVNSQYIKNEFIDYENAKTGYGKIVPKEAVLINSTGVGTLGRVNINLLNFDFSLDNHINVIVVDKTSNVLPCFLMIFLQTKYGQFQIEKYHSGSSGQIEIYPKDFDNFIIPLFPIEFQQEIEALVKRSHKCLEQSKDLYRQAEVLLYEELGLNPHNPLDFIKQKSSGSPKTDMRHSDLYRHSERSEESLSFKENQNSSPTAQNDEAVTAHNDKNLAMATKYAHLNISVRPLSQSLNATGRLDSEYYQQKYDEFERVIKNYRGGYCKLKDIGKFKNGSLISEDFYVEKAQRAYIRIKELSFNEPIRIAESIFIDDKFEAKNETIVKENDFVIATIGNTIGKVNLIPKELSGSFISNNTSRFRIFDNKIIPEFLELLLRSVLVQEQVLREFTQTAQPKISNYSLENILIPKIAEQIQTQIADLLKQSFALRKTANELLQTAKSKVQTAIEQGI